MVRTHLLIPCTQFFFKASLKEIKTICICASSIKFLFELTDTWQRTSFVYSNMLSSEVEALCYTRVKCHLDDLNAQSKKVKTDAILQYCP